MHNGPSSPNGESNALFASPTKIECSTIAPAHPSPLLRVSLVNNLTADSTGWIQPKSCWDVHYGILFVAQLTVVAIAGARCGPDALGEPDNGAHALLAYQHILALVVLALTLTGMMMRSRRLVFAVLLLAIGISFI